MPTEWNKNELRFAIEEWRESLYRQMAAQFSVNIAIVIAGKDKVIRRWVSAALADITGYEKDELESNPSLWPEIIHPADIEYVKDAISKLENKESFTLEYRIFRKDGRMRWVRESCTAEKESDKRYLRLLESIVDITDELKSSDFPFIYERVLNETPAAVAISDTSGRLLYCNDFCTSVIGADFVGRNQKKRINELLSLMNISQILADGYWEGEIDCHKKDGGKVCLRIAASVIHGADGGPTAIYFILNDITGHKSAEKKLCDSKLVEEALRESEEKYRNLVERLNTGIIVLQDLIIKFANRKFAAMLGYDLERIIGTPFTDYLTADEIAFVYDRYRRRMLGEPVPSVYETVMTDSDGENVDVEISADVITYQGKAADMILFNDIRERKKAEKALKESEEKYRTLVENVDAVILRLDSRLKLITIAGRPDLIVGYTIDELLGDSELWWRIVYSDDRGMLSQKLDEMAEKGEPASIDFRIVSVDGGIRWVHTHFVPQFDVKDNMIYIDGVALDITERVESQLRDERHAERMGVLAEISQFFTSSLDSNSILRVAAEKTANVLNCLAGIMYANQETGKVDYIVLHHENKSKLARVANAFCSIDVMEQDAFCEAGISARIIPDLSSVSGGSGYTFDQAGLGPGMMAPVSKEDTDIYVLICARFKGERKFDDEDLWFLTEIASRCSTALVNAGRYKRQSEIAETLQRSLIPSIPDIKCLDLTTLYSPAKGIGGVGGDFFDVIDFGGGVLGVVVGDVSGKGIDAAVHTAEAKYMLRGFAHQNHDPAYVMMSLNEALCEYINEFTFITLAYMLIDVAKHTITYSNAGHETPLILCTDRREILELVPNGPVLGVVNGQIYVANSLELQTDDILFCYTDGLVDVPVNDERFGYERLVDAIRRSGAVAPKELMDYVVNKVRESGKGQQPDDQVVVVARLTE